MAPESEAFGDYRILSEPARSAGGFAAHWLGVDRAGQRMFEVEVRVAERYAPAATTPEERQALAEQLGREWVRDHLRRTSFLRGVRYRVTYAAGQPNPTVEIIGRLQH